MIALDPGQQFVAPYPHEIEVSHAARLLARARVASTFTSRGIGLLVSSGLAHGEGVLLVPGGSIHTFFMRFAIDVLFLDSGFCVLSVASMQPWRAACAPRRTRYVLELRAGAASEAGISAGARLNFRSVIEERPGSRSP